SKIHVKIRGEFFYLCFGFFLGSKKLLIYIFTNPQYAIPTFRGQHSIQQIKIGHSRSCRKIKSATFAAGTNEVLYRLFMFGVGSVKPPKPIVDCGPAYPQRVSNFGHRYA
ncbi:MAG: hypothetical protein EBR82_49225, partial [Caulobacteraceae bacterium]|nr:hypothetical protein [Caulobacteraceae bacterium]